MLLWGRFRRIRRRRKSWRTNSGNPWRQRQQCQGAGITGTVGPGVSWSGGAGGGEPWCVTFFCRAR